MAGQDGGTNHNKDWDVNKKNITTINTLTEGTQKLKRSEMSVLCDCIRSRRAINIADIIKDY